jgi:hypothetical protein
MAQDNNGFDPFATLDDFGNDPQPRPPRRRRPEPEQPQPEPEQDELIEVENQFLGNDYGTPQNVLLGDSDATDDEEVDFEAPDFSKFFEL